MAHQPAPSATLAKQEGPSIGLVLGGGGARGLSHILVLEVFDELGLRPDRITGVSIGAIFGAAYASGLSALEIRETALEFLGKRINILKRLLMHGPGPLLDLWNLSPLSKSLLNPEALLDKIFPDQIATNFENLSIPLDIVATDFYAQTPMVLNQGSVTRAVAASIALPAIFTPIIVDQVPLIDGGMSNPLPYDLLIDKVDLTVAIDVTGGPKRDITEKLPSAMEVLLSCSQIMQNSLVNEKLKRRKPDILIRPPVDHIQVLAFHRIRTILDHSMIIKDQLKRKLDHHLTRVAL